MNEIFEKVGMITSFNDLRFTIDEIEKYIIELNEENENLQNECELFCELEKDNETLRKNNIIYYNKNKELKSKLQNYVNICEYLLSNYELLKKDFDNLCTINDNTKELLR